MALAGQMPAPRPANPVQARRQAELARTVELRKQAAAKKARLRAHRAVLDEKERRAREEYERRMAPIILEAQKQQAYWAIQQQKANAATLQAIGVNRQADALHREAGALQQEADQQYLNNLRGR
jgi:hypothetical protein